jgi:hypothetical protein
LHIAPIAIVLLPAEGIGKGHLEGRTHTTEKVVILYPDFQEVTFSGIDDISAAVEMYTYFAVDHAIERRAQGD